MDPKRIPELGLLTSASAPNALFDTAGELAAGRGVPLVISSPTSNLEIPRLRERAWVSTVVADPRQWARRRVGGGQATALDVGRPPLGLDEWAKGLLLSSGATWVLTPSFRVTTLSTLVELLDATEPATLPQLITHIPMAAELLDDADALLGTLAGATSRQLAFTITTAVDTPGRVRGLRRVLKSHPGAHVYGVTPLIALDALAGGAGLVAVDALSDAAPLPALFLDDLLTLRSPSVYADWYADRESPWCDTCSVRLDLFDATDDDRVAIGRHNAHAVDDLGRWLLGVDAADRPAALARRVAEALRAQAQLTGSFGDAELVADRALATLAAASVTE